MKSQRELVVSLLHHAAYGALATHSVAMPGFPFASALPFVTDMQHRPTFLLSKLAEHTQNLGADPRASLLLVMPELANVLTGARATLIGEVTRIEAQSPLLVQRYLRYHPEAADYLQLDFDFFRFEPQRVRTIAGFAQADWLAGADLLSVPALTLEAEAQIVEALRARLRPGLAIFGVDAYGLDYAEHSQRRRGTFPAAVPPEAVSQAARDFLQALK